MFFTIIQQLKFVNFLGHSSKKKNKQTNEHNGKNKFCPSLQAEAKSDSKWFRNGCQVGNEPLPKW